MPSQRELRLGGYGNEGLITLKVCYQIGEELISSIPFGGGVFKFARGAYPVLTILCTNCGYVANFSAVKVGLIKGEESNAD